VPPLAVVVEDDGALVAESGERERGRESETRVATSQAAPAGTSARAGGREVGAGGMRKTASWNCLVSGASMQALAVLGSKNTPQVRG
jgi:hypothetical protein